MKYLIKKLSDKPSRVSTASVSGDRLVLPENEKSKIISLTEYKKFELSLLALKKSNIISIAMLKSGVSNLEADRLEIEAKKLEEESEAKKLESDKLEEEAKKLEEKSDELEEEAKKLEEKSDELEEEAKKLESDKPEEVVKVGKANHNQNGGRNRNR